MDRRRPEIDESVNLELLPWGRTKEAQEALDAKKAQGRRGAKGCLFLAVLFALFAVYVAGWINGKYG